MEPITSNAQDFFPHGKDSIFDEWAFSLKEGVWTIGSFSAEIRDGRPYIGQINCMDLIQDEIILAKLSQRETTVAIVAIIDDDTAKGRGHLIHHIRISEELGLQLFLEKTILPEQIRNTIVVGIDDEEDYRDEEDAATKYIIPAVIFETATGPRAFDVLLINEKLVKKLRFPIATIDKDGQIV